MADEDDDIPVIDLTDPVNAFARDILRANPDDPRFHGPKIEIYSEEWMRLFGKQDDAGRAAPRIARHLGPVKPPIKKH